MAEMGQTWLKTAGEGARSAASNYVSRASILKAKSNDA